MPRKANPLRYIVFSPKKEYYTRLETIIMTAVKSISGELILVKEMGKKGDHPHLNLVYRDKTIKLNRKWENIIATQDSELVNENPHLIKTKNVFDKEKLINGYLTKETSAQILYSRYITQGETVAQKRESKKLQSSFDKYLQLVQRSFKDQLSAHQLAELSEIEGQLDSSLGT